MSINKRDMYKISSRRHLIIDKKAIEKISYVSSRKTFIMINLKRFNVSKLTFERCIINYTCVNYSLCNFTFSLIECSSSLFKLESNIFRETGIINSERDNSSLFSSRIMST